MWHELAITLDAIALPRHLNRIFVKFFYLGFYILGLVFVLLGARLAVILHCESPFLPAWQSIRMHYDRRWILLKVSVLSGES